MLMPWSSSTCSCSTDGIQFRLNIHCKSFSILQFCNLEFVEPSPCFVGTVYWFSHKMLCVPESAGQTVTCSTLSAPDAVKHKNSKGRRKHIFELFDVKKQRIKGNAYTQKHTCPTSPKALSRLLASVYFLTLLWSHPSSANLVLVSLRDLHTTTCWSKSYISTKCKQAHKFILKM